MRKHWDRWGWIVTVVVIAVGFLRVVWGRDAFCGEQSEQCFREWVSALGGWAAVAAAVPTVIYLARQVRDADEHQRENMKLQYARTRTLAKQAMKRATNLRRLIRYQQEEWEGLKENGVSTVPIVYMRTAAVNLDEVVPAQLFQRFEDEIDVPDGTDITSLKREISAALEYVNRVEDSSTAVALNNPRMEMVYKMAHNYAGMILEIASRHLSETATITGHKIVDEGTPSHD
ncbi:hypothetical protein EYD00_07270 [Agrobacterium sp. 33MFTa1.1]|uniref:hypothetical protein n=1 Tax=Agrobacterium sp. 33MFTa1.1 TaxID=1279031 RepID=UPI0005572279|nr:hypothetical protein [Agrobacterium sp. 33MFTa1.1]QBJ13207.1 hypothetical protein EYD00_07270 [Agrobacterium sp. 33MFTa1.1]